ncbi:Uncharacterised protein [Mycobacteroides abscessus]|nr:Uncharacterised protein [Mycobacteroides abscessus]SIB74449.1 Uncharacterised protein [Mycobacteroides abscessus subsp. abscessus]
MATPRTKDTAMFMANDEMPMTWFSTSSETTPRAVASVINTPNSGMIARVIERYAINSIAMITTMVTMVSVTMLSSAALSVSEARGAGPLT